MNNDKWSPILNVDLMKRKPPEWAKIYRIKVLSDIPNDELWSEYEWAYHYFNMEYAPVYEKQSFDKFEEMDARAMQLYTDLHMSADEGEKYVLKIKFILPEWIRLNIYKE